MSAQGTRESRWPVCEGISPRPCLYLCLIADKLGSRENSTLLLPIKRECAGFGEFWKILAVRFTVIDWISNTNDLIGIIIYLKCLFFDRISIFHFKCLNTIARCFSTFLEILHLSDVVIVYVSDRILVQGDIGVINNVKMNFNFLNSSLFSLFLWNWILNTNDRFDIIIQSI